MTLDDALRQTGVGCYPIDHNVSYLWMWIAVLAKETA